ncbi:MULTISPECIES: DUF2922 domain-containing protein [unclassified Enterococcus]|uniref:DUF2922 domain-containing protein n=1 Tax=unclassified Enterococcus TaxID=2608891 RepID=UPI000A34739A|nr:MULTISPECIES: DUF2922 family protein [unclassified Enterococcus]OTO72533.1 hypothetical protein A5865_001488 [Enterococcus sp. 12E11_DIV0728]OUZ13989.1 hypothetical protein A5868_003012 [Enterococcus sp. 12F9_DIV0723]
MKHKLVATFANEHGKQHKWTYKDIDTDLPAETIKEACELLTSLDIFEQDGVKLFDSVVTAKIVTTIEHEIFDRTTDPSEEAEVPTDATCCASSKRVDTVGLPAFAENHENQPDFPTVTLPTVPLHQLSSSETLPALPAESVKNSGSETTREALSAYPTKDSPPKSRKRLLSSLLRREKRQPK